MNLGLALQLTNILRDVSGDLERGRLYLPLEDLRASGCSIDGLFRTLQTLERALGTRLVAGGRVFYRDARGAVCAVSRAEFTARASWRARVAASTPARWSPRW